MHNLSDCTNALVNSNYPLSVQHYDNCSSCILYDCDSQNNALQFIIFCIIILFCDQ